MCWKVGICELPFDPISSEVVGGIGGTYVVLLSAQNLFYCFYKVDVEVTKCSLSFFFISSGNLGVSFVAAFPKRF